MEPIRRRGSVTVYERRTPASLAGPCRGASSRGCLCLAGGHHGPLPRALSALPRKFRHHHPSLHDRKSEIRNRRQNRLNPTTPWGRMRAARRSGGPSILAYRHLGIGSERVRLDQRSPASRRQRWGTSPRPDNVIPTMQTWTRRPSEPPTRGQRRHENGSCACRASHSVPESSFTFFSSYPFCFPPHETPSRIVLDDT